jgi:uncharacterized membrane protein
MSKRQERILKPIDPRYKGLGGWLYVLIISLTLFTPLVMLTDILESPKDLEPYFNRAPNLPVVIKIANIVGVCLIAFSIYAGLSIWNQWPNAVVITKLFLISFFATSIVLPFLPLMINLPESLHDRILDQVWYVLPKQLIFPVVWYSYLTFSKRVAATYQS